MKHMVNRVSLFTVLAGIVLTLSGLAHGECLSHQAKRSKKGTLKIMAATEIGGVTLEPGEYEVKQVRSKTGPLVRFSRFTDHAYAPEGVLRFDWETVAEVKVTLQQLCSRANRTELLLASDNHRPIGLEIRGNSVDYLF
jgi:hypothetical protein